MILNSWKSLLWFQVGSGSALALGPNILIFLFFLWIQYFHIICTLGKGYTLTVALYVYAEGRKKNNLRMFSTVPLVFPFGYIHVQGTAGTGVSIHCMSSVEDEFLDISWGRTNMKALFSSSFFLAITMPVFLSDACYTCCCREALQHFLPPKNAESWPCHYTQTVCSTTLAFMVTENKK